MLMIDVTQDIHSLTTFKRNSSGLMKHMKKTGRPLVLTINGKPEAVLLDPTTYQEVADHLDAVASIRRGLAQARKGEGREAGDVPGSFHSDRQVRIHFARSARVYAPDKSRGRMSASSSSTQAQA